MFLLTRRVRPIVISAATLATTAILLAGCAAGEEEPAASAEVGSTLEQITSLAQKEGEVHLIAYPEDWANYGASFDAFTAKYGVEVVVSNPDASSAEELTSVANLLGQPTQPDVFDIGYSFAEPAVAQDLVSPYIPTLADEIPDGLKDPAGDWTAAYYGVLSIAVNTDIVDVPQSWTDLLDPQYKGRIVVPDPRSSGIGVASVFAAALANGGDLDDLQPAIDFFAELASSGNLISSGSSNLQALETGEAAVVFDWNYNMGAMQETLSSNGVSIETVIPEDGVFGNFYAQPLTADSPHPNAARLWVEWLLSDDGANIYAEAGAVPARYAAMDAAGTLTDAARAKLPAAEVLEKVIFPTAEQGERAGALLADAWGPAVGY